MQFYRTKVNTAKPTKDPKPPTWLVKRRRRKHVGVDEINGKTVKITFQLLAIRSNFS